eukprot:6315014-Pyramimonas_sp.AAC.1
MVDGIKLEIKKTPRFSSQSVGVVGRAQQTAEGQIRTMRLDMEARLGTKIDPSMDIWPWMARHAGWILERYHAKANHRTAYEDCFGKAYQGEVLKFGEAALFKLSVTTTGK